MVTNSISLKPLFLVRLKRLCDEFYWIDIHVYVLILSYTAPSREPNKTMSRDFYYSYSLAFLTRFHIMYHL